MSLQLRAARFDDYQDIVRLEKKLNAEPVSADDWKLLWESNPLWQRLEKTWPIGWVLESDAGEIVGSIGNIPLEYWLHRERLVATTGRGWVVAPEYRAFALWLLEERFHQPNVDLFMDTTISPLALEAFDAFSERVPAGDWTAISYYVTGPRAFATRAMRKFNVPLATVWVPLAAAALRVKNAAFEKTLPQTRAAFTIEETDRFDSRFDAFWQELLRQIPDTLVATRDATSLTWHLLVAMRRRRVWILTARKDHRLAAYCIFKRQDRGDELPRMRLVDYQTIYPETDLLADFIAAALRRCSAEGVAVLDRPGVGLPEMRVFDEHAPYRSKQTWPFFYRAAGSDLAAQLRRPDVWKPSAYDGDASIE